MCHFAQKVHYCEIISIKCIFVEDDNKSIWFQYATNIQIREIGKYYIEAIEHLLKNVKETEDPEFKPKLEMN